MLTQVRSTLSRHNMLPGGMRVIAAVSGGADSVALLHILRELVPESLTGVAHFNHQLRGAESDADERFVAGLAKKLDLPFHHAYGMAKSGNLEQNARRERLAFYRSLIDQGAAERIALGHTVDDQAETVLFRILRGSGISGLCGILPVTAEGIVRPLLGVERAVLRDYLRERGIPWREDSTNSSSRFARNRIRQNLLPELQRDWNPRIVQALAHLGDVAYEEEVWWARKMARLEATVATAPGSVEIFVPPLQGLPRALVRRLAREAIRKAKGNLRGIDYAHVEQMAELAASPGTARCCLPGLQVARSFDWLLLRVPAGRAEIPPVPLARTGAHSWPPHNPLIQLTISIHTREGEGCDTLDLVLRGWRAGDAYQPHGLEHPVKLKEMFQKARVPSWRRASWPIVTGKGKILWAKGFGVAVDAPWITVAVSESFAASVTS